MSEPEAIVFVVDDDISVREAVAGLFQSAGLKVQTFASAPEFLVYPRADGPSCLVLDVRLPGLDGLDLQQRMAELDLAIPIVFITGHGDVPTTVRAMKAGAIEFLTKPLSDADLLEAVQHAIQRDRAERQQRAQLRRLQQRYELLTPRERQVMEGVVRGLLNKQIAGEMDITEGTVKIYLFRLFHKLGVRNRFELARCGILDQMQFTAPAVPHGKTVRPEVVTPTPSASLV